MSEAAACYRCQHCGGIHELDERNPHPCVQSKRATKIMSTETPTPRTTAAKFHRDSGEYPLCEYVADYRDVEFLERELNAARERIAELEAAPTPLDRPDAGWQPIETAPRDGTWVLIFDPMSYNLIYTGCWDANFDYTLDEAGEMQYVGKWTSYQVESFGYEEYAVLAPTHWMPLPANPPAEPVREVGE